MIRKLLAAVLVVGSAVMVSHLITAQPAVPLDPRVVVWDKGPAKVDVSKYPDDAKAGYKVFAEMCGKCHTLARAVNCDFALEDDWERYIKRMMRRANGMITPADAQKIYDFVVYDSKTRKKALYDMKLAARSK